MIVRGTLMAYDAVTGLASVRLIGGLGGGTYPVALDVDTANLEYGINVVVVLFDEKSVDDGVVIAVYGEAWSV